MSDHIAVLEGIASLKWGATEQAALSAAIALMRVQLEMVAWQYRPRGSDSSWSDGFGTLSADYDRSKWEVRCLYSKQERDDA